MGLMKVARIYGRDTQMVDGPTLGSSSFYAMASVEMKKHKTSLCSMMFISCSQHPTLRTRWDGMVAHSVAERIAP